MAVLKKTITLNYDPTDGDTIFAIPFDLSKYKTVDFQLNYTLMDVGDAVVKLQRSNDDDRYNDVPGATITLSETGANKTIDVSVGDSASENYQFAFDEGTDTTGSVESITLVAKTE